MAAVTSEEQFLCSICLDLFTDPVSTPCGHNFCRPCLSQHWNTSAPCRCPLCKEPFNTKPELRVNILLSELVSQFKQGTRRRSEVSKPGEVSKPEENSSPKEVSCDYCSAPKLKAVKSCLVCLFSYCESHLQPHLSVPRLKNHQLMEPVDQMEDRMCLQHLRPLELFCSSDHSFLCTMCVLEHKSHDFVSLKEEFDQRKVSLQQSQEQNFLMLEQRKQKIQELQSSVQLSVRAADTEKSSGLKVFNALIETVQKSKEKFIQDLEEKERKIQTQAENLIKQLQQEISELEKRSSEAELLLPSEDHLLFLKHCPSLPPTGLKDCSSLKLEPQTSEGTAAQALTELEKSLKEKFTEQMKTIPKGQLKRVQQFAVDLTLDTNTAQVQLSVSRDLKQVHDTNQKNFTDGPQRFSSMLNIFAMQSFSSGQFYFEVQVKDKTMWVVGVAKESVDRKKNGLLNSKHGCWCMCVDKGKAFISGSEPRIPLSLKSLPEKVGVFVDCGEGLVSFYDVNTADLIYSFTGISFREKLFPILNPCCYNYNGNNSAPLIITPVKK